MTELNKYNIGDLVWTVYGRGVREFKVSDYEGKFTSIGTESVMYSLQYFDEEDNRDRYAMFREKDIYATRKEAKHEGKNQKIEEIKTELNDLEYYVDKHQLLTKQLSDLESKKKNASS